jgi:hypothetical protein
MILNGLEFAGGLRKSADLRKYKFIPARAAENEYDPDGPLNIVQQIGNDRRWQIHSLDFLDTF